MSTSPDPRLRATSRHRAMVGAVAVSVLLALPAVVFFFVHDGGGRSRVEVLELGWGRADASESCSYDGSTEQMALRMRLRATTDGPVDVIAQGFVTRDVGASESTEYSGSTKVTVDGEVVTDVVVMVDVPVEEHAQGYDECALGVAYNRGEPWD